MFGNTHRQYAVVVVQSLWRMKGPRSAHMRALRYYRAARTIQACWRGREARVAYAQLIPLHRAAAVIQVGGWVWCVGGREKEGERETERERETDREGEGRKGGSECCL
jgi:hypothetical protein